MFLLSILQILWSLGDLENVSHALVGPFAILERFSHCFPQIGT
jgi:hypothetical protein